MKAMIKLGITNHTDSVDSRMYKSYETIQYDISV